MKASTINTFIIGFLLLGTLSVQAQEPKTITLNVNTVEITRQTVNANSTFGQDPRVSNEDFTIQVKVGETVVWNGLSTSSENDRVEIVSINHEGGARLFGRNVLNGENGIVSAKVTNGRNGDSEKYTIKFLVYRNGQRIPGTFQIDPKLVVRQ